MLTGRVFCKTGINPPCFLGFVSAALYSHHVAHHVVGGGGVLYLFSSPPVVFWGVL